MSRTCYNVSLIFAWIQLSVKMRHASFFDQPIIECIHDFAFDFSAEKREMVLVLIDDQNRTNNVFHKDREYDENHVWYHLEIDQQ